MKQGITQSIKGDRLGLTDLLEISDLLLRNQTFRFRVASWSMSPALQKGDQITVEPAIPTSLQVGDVILFHRCGQLICHRVVSLDTAGLGTRIITKGDAVTGCGETIQPDQVLGLVVGVKPNRHWAGSLSQRIDCWLERLRNQVAQGILALQGLRSYRRVMRALISRGFEYSIGVPEGRRWYRYHQICEAGGVHRLEGRHDFHLLAKLGGSPVASLDVVPRGEDYWLEALYVRLRYRGLGVASQLLTFAWHLALGSGAGRLLATVGAENSAALNLFDKMEFRPLTGSKPDGPPVLFRDLHG